jgi:uncharacterized protein YuzE
MATPPNIRRIRAEDFSAEDRELINKLSFSLNEFMDQTIFVLDGKVDFRNLNQQIVDVNIKASATNETDGTIINPPSIKTSVKGKVIGVLVINASNRINPAIIPRSQPFVQFTIGTDRVDILKVSGIQNNSEYTLKLLLIGQNIA